ncbi:NUMOD4 domain-containing protein [Flavobacterium sp.]|uniref:NUMOD4 domain-containing protein n=1 Tax=Flavobacterium sp. TaxID=239 RepID=UPI00342FA604
MKEVGYQLENLPNESWIAIQETNGMYEISSMGRVASNKTYGLLKRRILKPSATKKGYLRIYLSSPKRTILIHKLVATHFLTNPQNKETVNHINFNRSDNRVANLEWMTMKENAHHSRERRPQLFGDKRGENGYTTILTNQQVLEIRSKFIPRIVTREMLGKEYGVAATTIKDIVLRKSWTHI